MDRLRAARLPLHTMFVSHLRPRNCPAPAAVPADPLPRPDRHAAVARRPRGAPSTAAGARRHPRRQGRPLRLPPAEGRLRRLAGRRRAAAPSHGVGLEAPKALHGVMPRAKGVARAGLATVNRNLSPFVLGAASSAGSPSRRTCRCRSCFVPADVAAAEVGDELVVDVRMTTAQFDRLVTADATSRRPAGPTVAGQRPRGRGTRRS